MFASKRLLVVLGGEECGVREDIFEAAEHKVFIPTLSRDPSDSCNVAMAANTFFTERYRLRHYAQRVDTEAAVDSETMCATGEDVCYRRR